MIKLEDRIRAWATVGNILNTLSPEEESYVTERPQTENPWFTKDNVKQAIQRVIQYLDEAKLRQWTKDLPETVANPRKVGVVMADNIPLAGFHDVLTVLISGHVLMAKLNPKDTFLIKYVTGILHEIEPRFQQHTIFAEKLNDADAIIATGRDHLAKHFERYFAHIPHIIRKNRSSCAVLHGKETHEELLTLGKDMFLYFGLGSRNVSKLYVPAGYDFSQLLDALSAYADLLHHHRYSNHYDYHKSIYLVNREPHYDTGFALLRQNTALLSPVSVIYYEEYTDQPMLDQLIAASHTQIQHIVSQNGWYADSYPFGKAQNPALWDDAGGVNTLAFIQQNL